MFGQELFLLNQVGLSDQTMGAFFSKIRIQELPGAGFEGAGEQRTSKISSVMRFKANLSGNCIGMACLCP